jgi:signal transduction histidine kinase
MEAEQFKDYLDDELEEIQAEIDELKERLDEEEEFTTVRLITLGSVMLIMGAAMLFN